MLMDLGKLQNSLYFLANVLLLLRTPFLGNMLQNANQPQNPSKNLAGGIFAFSDS